MVVLSADPKNAHLMQLDNFGFATFLLVLLQE
jgi:hypothetical protein